MNILERNELVTNYIPLANKIASQKNKITPKNITLDELKSAASLGLIDAANRFSKEYNCSFSTYAKIRISGEIKDYLRKNRKKHSEIPADFSHEYSNYYNNMDLFPYIFSFLDFTGQNIIKMYYIENKSLKQIGKSLDITESRVCQLISKYKKMIRKKI